MDHHVPKESEANVYFEAEGWEKVVLEERQAGFLDMSRNFEGIIGTKGTLHYLRVALHLI